VQHVGWIRHRALRPVCNVLSKPAAHLRIETDYVVLTQRLQARIGPIAHRNHHGFLIHLEFASLGEMQTTLPGVAKAIRPFPRITVTLVPDIFFRPQPALLTQGQDQFDYISMALAVFSFFFNVENKRACRFEDTKELGRTLQKPGHIFLWLDAAISVQTAICIRWRRYDEIEKIIRVMQQFFTAIPMQNFGFDCHRAKPMSAFRQGAIRAPACRARH